MYSNCGFGLLGYVLSDEVTAQSFGDMMRSIIFDPLNMSTSALTTDEKVKTFACGHDYDGQVIDSLTELIFICIHIHVVAHPQINHHHLDRRLHEDAAASPYWDPGLSGRLPKMFSSS